jgi:hypothetical protein
MSLLLLPPVWIDDCKICLTQDVSYFLEKALLFTVPHYRYNAHPNPNKVRFIAAKH